MHTYVNVGSYGEGYEKIAGKNLCLTGCPSGGDDSKYFLRFVRITDADVAATDYGNGIDFVFTHTNTTLNSYVVIFIASGYTANNLIFKPMLTLASVPNSDYNHYVPYAKSNRELTEDVDFYAYDNTTLSGVECIRKGNIVQLNINGTWDITQNQSNSLLFTVPDPFKPQTAHYNLLPTVEVPAKIVSTNITTGGSVRANGWQVYGTGVALIGSMTYIGKDL